jgi:predicted metal-dependent hydrolase
MVDMEIELVRGTRRRKYVEAVLVGDRLRVSFPYWMSVAEAQVTAEELAERMRRRTESAAIDVGARARRLAREYGLPRARSVRWVDNMRQRWGSCTPEDGTIRVSSRLAAYPSWVLDYVLVHELAHLSVANHGSAHDALVDAFPYAERARGFLMAVDLDPHHGDDAVPSLLAGDVRP